jgi:hypothetical protein
MQFSQHIQRKSKNTYTEAVGIFRTYESRYTYEVCTYKCICVAAGPAGVE